MYCRIRSGVKSFFGQQLGTGVYSVCMVLWASNAMSGTGYVAHFGMNGIGGDGLNFMVYKLKFLCVT